jgi:hypothetical protein
MRLCTVDDGIIMEYRAVGGMKIGRGSRSSRRLLAWMPLCLPQISYQLAQKVGKKLPELWHGLVSGILEEHIISQQNI